MSNSDICTTRLILISLSICVMISTILTFFSLPSDNVKPNHSSSSRTCPNMVIYIWLKIIETYLLGQNAFKEKKSPKALILTLYLPLKPFPSVIFILGYTDDIRDIMLRALDMEMLNGYAWIGIDLLA